MERERNRLGDEVMSKRRLLNGKVIWKYIVLFLFFFLIQYKFRDDVWFGTDELDVFLGGKTIAKGYLLYKDFISQHMPGAYYISAFFELLGANTVLAQRICFYLFYAFFWTIMYKRYSRYVGKYTLILYPILFCGIISTYDLGTTVLSEHIAAIGLMMLFLEFIRFVKEKELKWDNYLCISISVILSFGTLFIAIFPVAMVALGVVLYEIKWAIEDKEKFGCFVIRMLKKYVPLVLWVAIPWVVLFIYYWINDCLDVAFLGAYTLNREIYPSYTGGYGGSIIDTLIGIPESMASDMIGTLSLSTLNYTSLLHLLLYFLAFVFITKEAKKKGALFSVVSVFLLFASSTRACFNFHGTHWVAILAFMAAQVISELLIVDKETLKKSSIWHQSGVVILISFFMLSYISTFSDFATNNTEEENLEAKYLNCITDEDEAVWQTSIGYNPLVMQSDRASVMNAASTPWTWEAFGEINLERLENEKPRVLIYNPEAEVWGYYIKDYAPEMGEYLAENYTNYPGTSLYIRNDYFEEASKKITRIQ